MSEQLRVAFITGSLGIGGAEKQLIYMVRSLLAGGVDVRVYTLTQGEYYQSILEQMGAAPVYFGQSPNPVFRMVRLARELDRFRPHITQSTQFFTNLYAAVVGRWAGALTIGSIRADVDREFRRFGGAAPRLARWPAAIVANSSLAREKLVRAGLSPEQVFVLANVIDLEEFDEKAAQEPSWTREDPGTPVAMVVARLNHVKRLERFIRAICDVRARGISLEGVIVGDGPERAALELEASQRGLLDQGIRFLGTRQDIPALLQQADLLALTSEYEGFPNALLEGMAACLPVVSTPAGDAARVIQEGLNGFIVPMDDPGVLADRLGELAQAPHLREAMGAAGRRLVEQRYSDQSLRGQLMEIYRKVAEKRQPVLLRILTCY